MRVVTVDFLANGGAGYVEFLDKTPKPLDLSLHDLLFRALH